MDFAKLIADLHTQREQLTQAIIVLERLAAGTQKRRGRPPKWLADAKAPDGAVAAQNGPVKKRVVSAETRRKMAEAQRRRRAAAVAKAEAKA